MTLSRAWIFAIVSSALLAASVAAPQAKPPGRSPFIDIRDPAFAGGAICDGARDIGPALQAAVDALPANGGEIHIVSSPVATNECYWANPTPYNAMTDPTGFRWPSKRSITLRIEGTLKIGTTLSLPPYVDIVGMSGSLGTEFQGTGQIAALQFASGGGTLGTAVTTIGTPGRRSNYDPSTHSTTFTPSSMTGLYPGTAITVAGYLTCTPKSLARASGLVTAAWGRSCHIPAGVRVNISGCSDASFNADGLLVTASDYVQDTATWRQKAADSTASRCSVTGEDEDSIETTVITATTATTATAVFFKTHSAADKFGVVGLEYTGESHNHLKDMYVGGASGTQIWLNGASYVTLENSGAAAFGAVRGNIASFPVELNRSFIVYMNHFAADCSNQPWCMHLTDSYTDWQNSGGSTGWINIQSSEVVGGIKMDHGASGVALKDTILEIPTRGGIQYDPTDYIYWGGLVQSFLKLDNTGLQDNFSAYRPCLVYELYNNVPGGLAAPSTDLDMVGTALTPCLTNDYFHGALTTHSVFGGKFSLDTARGVVGNWNDGKTLDADIRGSGAAFGVSLIPYSTLPVKTDPSSWTGSCKVTTGVEAPDRSSTAGALTSSSVGNVFVEQYRVTPAPGDIVLYGGWAMTPTEGRFAVSNSLGAAFLLDHDPGSHFQFDAAPRAGSNPFDSQITDDWWHPIVAVAQITGADGKPGTVRLSLGCDEKRTMDYWMPFMIYVPASAHVPLPEIMRWRQQLLHGYVPAGVRGPAYVADPNLTVTGKLGSTSMLSDWSDSGLAGGMVPVWNSTTGKWTPGSPSGGPVVVARVAPAIYSGMSGVGPTTFYTTPAAHQYQACAFVDTTLPGTAGNYAFMVSATSDGHAASFLEIGNVSLTTQWSSGQSCTTFYADASTPVKYRLAMNGAGGNPAIRYAVTLTELQ